MESEALQLPRVDDVSCPVWFPLVTWKHQKGRADLHGLFFHIWQSYQKNKNINLNITYSVIHSFVWLLESKSRYPRMVSKS